MNDLRWLYWDRESAQTNQRQRRVIDVVRTLSLTSTQIEQFLMLEPGQLTQWCQGELSNRYAAMRLVRIHRVVLRNREFLPARRQMPDWMSRKLVNGRSALDVLADPYFLEHRLEQTLALMARRSGQRVGQNPSANPRSNVVPISSADRS